VIKYAYALLAIAAISIASLAHRSLELRAIAAHRHVIKALRGVRTAMPLDNELIVHARC